MTSASYLSGSDGENIALILELQMGDVQTIYDSSTDKGRAGATDQEYALQLYLHELSITAQIVRERRELEAEELRQLSRDQEPSDNNNSPWNGSFGSDLTIASRHFPGTAFQPNTGESSGQGASRAVSKSKSPDRQCTACLEDNDYSEWTRTPCGHDYCDSCIDYLFLSAVKDETLYPPHCCGIEIPLSSVLDSLEPQTETEFRKKVPEWETKDRTYCSLETCSTWIPPDRISSEVGTCPSCGAQTCTLCKAGAHHDSDCPQDESTQQLIQFARENDWQRCYRCRHLVELMAGCYHITCVCRAEWCYLCRAPWKTCACQQADEEYIVRRAEDVVERLQQNQECDHQRSRRVGGPARCGACNNQLRFYAYECRECRLRLCSNCRRDRL